MKVELTETGPCRRRLQIEVEPEVVENRVADEVREYRRTRAIPGFRQGRASESLIRARFGKEIRAHVLQHLIPEVWNQAIDDNDLDPVNQPELTDVKNEPGEVLTIDGEVEVKPKVEIQNYKGLKVTRDVRKVADEDVDKQVEFLRQERADESPVERPAQMNDVVVASVQITDAAGVPIIGKRDENRRWQLGGIGSVSQDMDEQLVGMAKGEPRRVTFHYRADLYDQQRAGKEDHASVTISEIFERQLPTVDDEFAKDLGDFATVDDLKKAIREDLERRTRQYAREGVHRQIRDRVVQENLFEVPESMVVRFLDRLYEDHARQGHQHDRDEFFTEHRAEAVNRVRGMLALERIAEQEDIAVPDADVDASIAAMAARMRMSGDEFRRRLQESGRYESIRADMVEEKVLDRLEEQAEVEEVEVKEGS